jgi:hypothetical protein
MRTLVDTVPAWVLAIVFVGGSVVLALLGFMLTDKLGLRSPSTGVDTWVSALSNKVNALFGILLVFVIVSEFNHYEGARRTAEREATALAELVRDSRAFPNEQQSAIAAAVIDYGNLVVHEEWDSLATDGTPSPAANRSLGELELTLQRYEPRGPAATTFYGEAADKINDVVDARRDRISAADHAIPDVLLWLVLFGGVCFVATSFGFSAGKDDLLLTMMVLVAALTGAGLLVVTLFDYPFSGSLGVSSAAFHEGVLQGLIRR